MARPTVVLLQSPEGNEIFLNQVENVTLSGDINCLAYAGKGYKVLVPEPAVEEWEKVSNET